MRLRFAFFALTCVSWGLVQACGGDSGVDTDAGQDVTVNDVSQPPPDSSPPDVVTTPDTGTDADTGDVVTTTDATTQDSGANIGSWKCGSVTVADCSQCTGFFQPCAYCSVTDASVVTGVCTQIYTNCLNAIPNGYQDCPCTPGDASTCIEGYQVCSQQGRCHTCTDSVNNNTLKCENDLTCAADAGCK